MICPFSGLKSLNLTDARMTDTNSTTLRNVLSAAIKSHISESGLSMKDAAALAGVHLSRLYQVTRGDVSKVSSDAMANILQRFGYKLTGDCMSFSLTRDDGEPVLPEIEKPDEIKVEVGGVLYDIDDPVIQFKDFKKAADFDPDFDRVSTDE